MKSKKLFLLAAGLFLVAAIGLLELRGGFPTLRAPNAAVAEGGAEQHLSVIQRVHALLLSHYVNPIRSQTLVAGAMSGMEAALKKLKPPASLPSLPTLQVPALPADPGEGDRDGLARLRQVYLEILSRHRDKLTSEDLFKAAMAGMFRSLGDPHTTYLSPRDFRRLNELMQGGNFGGIGIYIELDKENKNRLMVVKPIEGTPAHRAGLKAGDYIVFIDGHSTEGIDLQKAQDLIRGREGTRVTLLIERRAHQEPRGRNGAGNVSPKVSPPRRLEFTLVREQIHVKSASVRMLEGGIGYVELSNFGEYTGREMEEGLATLEHQHAKGVVLDLRNNGGGYVTAAIDVTSRFLPPGSAIVSLVDRNHREKRFRASSGGRSRWLQERSVPVVVLVNRFSASASEITAGALQDHGRARLVGDRTFGKASVQTIHPLETEYGGGALKLTTAKYLTPNGRDISKKGIHPDIVVGMKERPRSPEEDVQLQKAVEALKNP